LLKLAFVLVLMITPWPPHINGVHEVKGKIKESVGRVINNPNLEGEGIGP
jgi:hypothetical protein